MRAHDHVIDGTSGAEYLGAVTMTQEEAERLDKALSEVLSPLRERLRELSNRTLALGWDAAQEFAALRKRAVTLEEFRRAHCRAHGLPSATP